MRDGNEESQEARGRSERRGDMESEPEWVESGRYSSYRQKEVRQAIKSRDVPKSMKIRRLRSEKGVSKEGRIQSLQGGGEVDKVLRSLRFRRVDC